MKKITTILSILLCLIACTEKEENLIERVPLELLSITPANQATGIPAGTTTITYQFNQHILIADTTLITINNQPTKTIHCSNEQLIIQHTTSANTTYTVTLEKGAIKTIPGLRSEDPYTTTFTTTTEEPQPGNTNKTPEATALLNYLTQIQGQQTLSGCMANVNWNINEATWIYKHTGKWPAINGFDYIHHYASTPGGWIDYQNTTVAEKWHNDGGIITAMWHWNQPANDGTNYTCTPGTTPDGEHTSFDIRKIDDPQSPEYQQIINDLDQIAGYLQLLKQKNIPILWRPLHEAAGNYHIEAEWGTAWFWWGYHGPEYFKKLWHLMHDRFTNTHGLNNLIWIWTYEPIGHTEWYPGDQYVDITGSDIYNQHDNNQLATQYNNMNTHFPTKPAILAECGNLPPINQQWEAGARWTYFTTWYDYNRTNDITSTEYNQKDHEHADITWWTQTFQCPHVLSRDQLPKLY